MNLVMFSTVRVGQ